MEKILKLLPVLILFGSLLLVIQPARAGTYLSYDFEDGQIPNDDTLMSNNTPTVVLLDPDGNRFVRMTVSSSDCGPAYNTTCPWNRAELLAGAGPNIHNRSVTYGFSVRIPSSNPAVNHLLVQAYQGYRITFGYGRTFWLGTSNGGLFVQNDVGENRQRISLGLIDYDKWVNYALVVYLSTDPSLGRIDVYSDDQLIGSITGQATEKTSQYPSDLFFNVVDFKGAPGTADFDNVQISMDGSPAP